MNSKLIDFLPVLVSDFLWLDIEFVLPNIFEYESQLPIPLYGTVSNICSKVDSIMFADLEVEVVDQKNS